jgi:hypothetical protein
MEDITFIQPGKVTLSLFRLQCKWSVGMKCDRAQELFSDYFEGNLERPMAFTLEHHLSECPACERDFQKFSDAWAMLDAIPEVEVPLGFRASVMERIEAQEAARKQKAWSIDLSKVFGAGVKLRPVAALAAVALFAVMLVQHPQTSSIDTGKAIPGIPKIKVIGPENNYTISSLSPEESSNKRGLEVQVKALSNGYNLHFVPEHGASINARAHAFSEVPAVFGDDTQRSGMLIMDQNLMFDRTHDVQTNANVVLVTWEYDSKVRSEIMILPSKLVSEKAGKPFSVSNTYGVIVFAEPDLSGTVSNIELSDADVNTAAETLTKDLGIDWRPLVNAIRVVK